MLPSQALHGDSLQVALAYCLCVPSLKANIGQKGSAAFAPSMCRRCTWGGVDQQFVRGLLGTGPPDPTLPFSGGRFGIEIRSNQEIDVESMPNRC